MKIFIAAVIFCFTQFVHSQEQKIEYEELAIAYQSQGKDALAAEYFNKAGYAYWNAGQKLQAAEAFTKTYDLLKASGNEKALLSLCNNIGVIYLDLDRFNNSLTYFSTSLALARTLKDKEEIFNSLINLSSVCIELTRFSEAIAKSSEAQSIATELNNLKLIARSYGVLAEAYEKNGDSGNAFKYYELFSTISKKLKEQEIESVKNMSEEEVRQANENKRVAEIELKIKKGELKETKNSLAISEQLIRERQMQLELRNAQLKEKDVELRLERHVRNTLIISVLVVLCFLAGLGFLLRLKLRDNKILKRQKEEITQQRNRLDEQNKKITDSIHYGLRIQQAMLPNESKFMKLLETFIIYKPKDIVSGDFYWYYSTQHAEVNYMFLAVADCTGHGVPGAFMSMIGHRLLTEIIVDRKIYDPATILEEVNICLRKDLDQDSRTTMDGMDIALCRISLQNEQYSDLVFVGAKRNLIIYRSDSNNMEILEGNHKTIGGPVFNKTSYFSNKKIAINKNDLIFLYTDGIIDQHNRERSRFGTTRFVNALKSNVGKPLAEQKSGLLAVFEAFKGNEEQRDDITVFGAKII